MWGSWPDIKTRIVDALEGVCANPDNYQSEAILQQSLAMELPGSASECTALFTDPPIAPKTPSPDDVQFCLDRNRILPENGKDPCDGRQRKLDILWEDIPIELKSVTALKSDVYGYQFLKDIHRMERLARIEGVETISEYRICIFVASDSACWKKADISSAPQVYDGMAIESGHWVQYTQPSPVTRWFDYPPFYLAGSYDLKWISLPNEARYLIVEVQRQTPTSDLTRL